MSQRKPLSPEKRAALIDEHQRRMRAKAGAPIAINCTHGLPWTSCATCSTRSTPTAKA